MIIVTASQKMNPRLKILIPVVRGLAKILGKDYEVNLHDVSMPEHSLVLCENGYVTGRREGGPMTDFGLFMLQSEEYQSKDGIYNYCLLYTSGPNSADEKLSRLHKRGLPRKGDVYKRQAQVLADLLRREGVFIRFQKGFNVVETLKLEPLWYRTVVGP